jgi:hypothetical protein
VDEDLQVAPLPVPRVPDQIRNDRAGPLPADGDLFLDPVQARPVDASRDLGEEQRDRIAGARAVEVG